MLLTGIYNLIWDIMAWDEYICKGFQIVYDEIAQIEL